MQNWDDLRFLLAVFKAGTMSAAARELGINVATVSRRLDRLGAELGGAPFVKTPTGWQPSPHVAGLLEAAAAFEGQMRESTGERPEVVERPQVRLGAPPLISSTILLPNLGGTDSPLDGVDIELVQRIFETGLGGHDIVVQAGRPESGRLAIRRAGVLRFGVYGWRDQPTPERWIGLTEAHEPFPPIDAARAIFDTAPAIRLENFDQVFQAAQALRLPAPLPEILAAREPDLVRLDTDREAYETEFWVLFHLTRRSDPAVQRVADWIVQSFDAAGQTPGKTLPARRRAALA